MLFIMIVDTLPSLPACSDNEMKKNVPISDEGIIVITDTDDDLIFNTIIHNIQSSIGAKTT